MGDLPSDVPPPHVGWNLESGGLSKGRGKRGALAREMASRSRSAKMAGGREGAPSQIEKRGRGRGGWIIFLVFFVQIGMDLARLLELHLFEFCQRMIQT
jgi:hypothetical protein